MTLQHGSGFLPYIDMNQPWIYMCSPSQSPLPPPSPSHPSAPLLVHPSTPAPSTCLMRPIPDKQFVFNFCSFIILRVLYEWNQNSPLGQIFCT